MPESPVQRPVGVIGAGSFGTAIANLLAYNSDVFLYSRNIDLVNSINASRENLGIHLSASVQATNDLQQLAETRHLLFYQFPENDA